MLQINLFEYLQESALRSPDKLAFIDEGESLSYAALLSRAEAIGSAIAARREPGSPVVVLSERSAAAAAALQGALSAACYYVPIDPKTPELRLGSILRQLGSPLVLCPDGLEAIVQTAFSDAEILSFSQCAATEATGSLLEQRRDSTIDADPAYMIFTSGSTGKPKGIIIPHRSVIDFTEWMVSFCEVSENDVMANQAPFFFDLSVKDLYTTLKCGATLMFPPQSCYVFPIKLAQYIEEHSVTALFWATSAFHLLASSGALEKVPPSSLRIAALGGEALQARMVNTWLEACPDLDVVNLYGPTEATVDCTAYRLNRRFGDDEAIPIGSSCRNKKIILLDSELKPVENGETGEICVRGTGLAKGYYADDEKTNAAFIKNPLCPNYPDILYRTGDLAAYGDDGLLYFRSRQDGQIKHMGYRIELGEVETAVLAENGITAAVCLYDAEKLKIVCIFSGDVEGNALARALRRRLPKYMLPNIYHVMETLPMTPNGKIDRVALREMYAL